MAFPGDLQLPATGRQQPVAESIAWPSSLADPVDRRLFDATEPCGGAGYRAVLSRDAGDRAVLVDDQGARVLPEPPAVVAPSALRRRPGPDPDGNAPRAGACGSGAAADTAVRACRPGVTRPARRPRPARAPRSRLHLPRRRSTLQPSRSAGEDWGLVRARACTFGDVAAGSLPPAARRLSAHGCRRLGRRCRAGVVPTGRWDAATTGRAFLRVRAHVAPGQHAS